MKFFMRVFLLCCVLLVLFLSFLFLFLAIDWLRLETVAHILHDMPYNLTTKIVLSVLAVVLIFENYLLYQIVSEEGKRGKTIAFDNPSGRVSVSLVALENLIRQKVSKLNEVKEVKVNIAATKKELKAVVKLILTVEVNIPEVTSRVQDIVKQKIQDTIGIEQSINVAVYVGKILPEQINSRRCKEKEGGEEKTDSHLPFQGYRA
ncbi:MAG TPA: alkaline shock response membrane anchor protein AmaP [Candidatus Omnitrophica bacterium]|nr:MAG: hypothetical protein A2Z81_00360 [Omnitrophica WOR_2 bacterium GWA2_45_18]OGX19644.1 MAG: hypothetical protein A2Y04_02905 [Omnitrophica WOR_2 bacterium GWC2_45_7]HBR14682.1 alkaline shock response membrane anchor protein AmaP [Candidatus Omnitrophota bacterium]